MKVLRYRIRVISLIVCAVAGVVGITGLPTPLWLATTSASTPTATAAASSELTSKPSEKKDFKTQACPPVTTIHGILGSGSADYPATTGQQTGRLVNGLGNTNCGSSNPCNLNTPTGSRAFDTYTFSNPGATTACVTVDFSFTGCVQGASLQFSARLGTFDPANPCANYVGDGGAGFAGGSHSFSFNVPAGQDFVVVVNEDDPGVAVGCGYTLAISGLACQAIVQCPPTTPINGTVGSGSPDYPATSGQQTGRLLNGLGNVSCGNSNPCSLNTPTGSRAFDAYTFSNPGATTACVTVNFNFSGCAASALLQFSARLGSFDPANPCANYVGDGGAGFAGGSHSFSFNVPAGQNFVVVVNENDPGTATGCAYTLTLSGISCEPLCPPTTGITGTLGSASQDYPSTTGSQSGRLTQNGVDSSCATPKTCPGAILGSTFIFDAYQFQNVGTSTACATITFQTGCGVNQAVHPVAYLGSFDPNNICTNYLGDLGHSINAGESGSFSVSVPAGQVFTLVIHRSGTVEGCDSYHFTVTGLPGCDPNVCPGIVCPSNIIVPNTPGQCSAVVNYATPAAQTSCGTVTCSPASGSTFPTGTTTVTCNTTSGSSCSFTVRVNDTQPPSITCPANVTVSNSPGQCSATVNYPSPSASDNCGVVGLVCSPQSGSTFAVGTTTVNCTATDGSGGTASCSFTVRVNDTQPPIITCPANITAVATATCPATPTKVVTFAAPTATDNCPGVTALCSPASGSTFPVGTTTVTCTATDVAGNTATCGFTVTVFNVCLQDDSNPTSVLLFNSITGDYRFCCGGTTFTGRGTVTIKGCTITLQHNPSDRRVVGSVDHSMFKGSASLQSPPGTTRCTITDKDTRNNSCLCQ